MCGKDGVLGPVSRITLFHIFKNLYKGNHFGLWWPKDVFLLLFGVVFCYKLLDGKHLEPAVKNLSTGKPFIHGAAIVEG